MDVGSGYLIMVQVSNLLKKMMMSVYGVCIDINCWSWISPWVYRERKTVM